MVQVELYPDLTHCIETQAKREYGNAMKKLLTAEGSSEALEERLELLRLFLEEADFKNLRRESEKHLMEGRRVRFNIHLDNGRPQWQMQVLGNPGQ